MNNIAECSRAIADHCTADDEEDTLIAGWNNPIEMGISSRHTRVELFLYMNGELLTFIRNVKGRLLCMQCHWSSRKLCSHMIHIRSEGYSINMECDPELPLNHNQNEDLLRDPDDDDADDAGDDKEVKEVKMSVELFSTAPYPCMYCYFTLK